MDNVLAMLQNAKVQDLDGIDIADVTAVTFAGGKMIITIGIDMDLDDEFSEDDPDGGEELDEDDDEEEEKKFPHHEPIKLVANANG